MSHGGHDVTPVRGREYGLVRLDQRVGAALADLHLPDGPREFFRRHDVYVALFVDAKLLGYHPHVFHLLRFEHGGYVFGGRDLHGRPCPHLVHEQTLRVAHPSVIFQSKDGRVISVGGRRADCHVQHVLDQRILVTRSPLTVGEGARHEYGFFGTRKRIPAQAADPILDPERFEPHVDGQLFRRGVCVPKHVVHLFPKDEIADEEVCCHLLLLS